MPASVPESSPAYPGSRLGLPEDGIGSIAGYGRRVGALFLDWGLACVLAAVFFDYHPMAIELIFLALTMASIMLIGGTIGHTAFGMRLNTIAGAAPGFWRPVVRQLLFALILPLLLVDEDGRGAHDRISGLVLRRFR